MLRNYWDSFPICVICEYVYGLIDLWNYTLNEHMYLHMRASAPICSERCYKKDTRTGRHLKCKDCQSFKYTVHYFMYSYTSDVFVYN